MANFSKPQSMMSMLFALFALLQVTVAAQHGAHSHAHVKRNADAIIQAQVDEVQAELNKRQGGGIGPYIAINGVCSSQTVWWGDCDRNNRQSYPRLEIRQLNQNSDQWNLYLIGMERFMSKNHGDTLGYYQIAGVHGRPFTTWNRFPTPLVNNAGFCPHGSTLFGSWHRPYLAVFEQAWYLAVTEVINDFPSNQQQRWRNAAATLRMPYWDWAQDPGTNNPTVPTLIRDQRVWVTKPEGRVEIDNPIYSFSWGNTMDAEMGGGPWDSWPRTLRRPVGNPTRSNNNEMNGRFDAMRISLRDRVFALFSSKQSWGYASTSQIGVRTDLSGSGVDSFESVHDSVHNAAGGETGGHMYYLDQSAFDPIFWLHHTNVDRLLSMYQYIVPNTYVANGNIPRGMAQWNAGEPKNSYTPLKPFTKGTYGDYYTSEDIRDTRTLGYYYPETSDRSYSQVARAVTNLYGAGVRQITKRASDNVNSVGQYLGRPLEEGDYNHVLDIQAEKYAMDGSYTIHCFIGNNGNSTSNSTAPYGNSTAPYSTNSTSTYSAPTSYATPPAKTNGTAMEDYDPSKDFTQDPNYVGAYGVLGHQGGMGMGQNTSQSVLTRGSLPLTTCLQGKQAYGYLESLKPEHVEPYLAKNMYYKIIGPNGEIDPSTIPNFHIAVKCNKVIPAASPDELPDLSAPYEVLPKATEKLPCGTPYTYTPQPIDTVAPDASYAETGYNGSWGPNDNGGNYNSPGQGGDSYGSMPGLGLGNGYCPVVKTIKYVYPDGKDAYY